MGLTKRKDSYYVAFSVIVSDDGKTLKLAPGVPGSKLKRWKVGCLNKSIAKEMEATIRTNLLQGKVLTEEAKPVLFSEWAKQYLNLEEVKRLKSYKGRVYSITKLADFLGRKALTDIRVTDIEAYRVQRKSGRKGGGAASLQTINHDHVALKHCLNVAVKRGLLSSNPAGKVSMPNPHNERDRVLSAEEWERLYQSAKPHIQPVLLLAYHLGQRFSEITGLTWDRVDLKRGFITLRAIDTKTRKARQVPMTPQVRITLQKLAKVRVIPMAERSLATNHVFLYKGEPIKRISRSFRTALREAKVSDFRFHDLRHCASTNLRRAGVDTATAMSIIGHQSDKMWKRYNAIEERDLRQAADKLERYFEADTVMTLDQIPPEQSECK
jgi:integrase